MATTLWGKVYNHNQYAGILRQEPGGRYAYIYDPDYIASGSPAIAYTLPVREAPYFSESRLHPFFDNLVAEGWLRNAQARALGTTPEDRFSLLLAFGQDCMGAISIIDPEPVENLHFDQIDRQSIAALTSRASLSGIQPKLLAVKGPRGYRPAREGERSTHLAKLPSGQIPDIIELEWLTTLAAKKLLPEEPVAEMEITALSDIAPEALVIRRFDRTMDGHKIHFEEFNQILGKHSDAKYNGNYEDMTQFLKKTPGCTPAEAERLFRRVLVCLLIGNTDAHLKNFALFHQRGEMHLTPCYDLVASAYYKQFQTMALSIAGAKNISLGKLQPKHITMFGENTGLSSRAILLALDDIKKRLEPAKAAVNDSDTGHKRLRDGIINLMEKRWKGTFELIGLFLSKKQSGGGKRKGFLNNGSPP